MSFVSATEQTSWAVNPYPWRDAERLADLLGLPLIVAMILVGRGLRDPAEARAFLERSAPLPDPFLFGHMQQAVDAISAAIEQGRRIVIHGDYDADGITATALLLSGLGDLGTLAEWYLPNRFNEGYGLSRRAVETIAGAGPALLITVDCGVNYPEEVEAAKDAGLEVIVVDHHRPGAVLPDCHVIHEAVGEYPHGDLCGVGLALKVMHALHVRLTGAERGSLPNQLYRLLDLVAVGTIADLASLRGENRYYVHEGLKLVGIGQRVGLRALASVSGCAGSVDSGTVAYRLAPRLNAAGRLADPSPPLRLLLTDDEDEARVLAAELHELNGARQELERQILAEAVEHVEAMTELPPAIVLSGANWHEGVVGIVASRLVERYHRPTVLLGIRDGVAKGSGRSIAAYDLMDGLNAAAEHLTVYGGHSQAVGLTLEDARVNDLRRTIESHASSLLTLADLTPSYRADAVLRGIDMSSDTAAAINSLGPFGSGNPRPRLLLTGADILDPESTRNGAHLRCAVEIDGVRARGIGFGLGGMAGTLREEPQTCVVGAQLRADEWQGVPRVEVLIERIGRVDAEPLKQDACTADSTEPIDAPIGKDAEDAAVEPEDLLLHMPSVRDHRGQQGLASAIAQVLATGETVLLLTCSVPQTLSSLHRRIPFGALAGGEPACVSRGSARSAYEEAIERRVAVAEWDATAARALAPGRSHVIAVDPPYRVKHVGLLRNASAHGAVVHLAYGDEERQMTLRLLRYLIHPRFAMVCAYRAMQEAGGWAEPVAARARELGWSEAGVLLTGGDLARAHTILAELGIERPCPGEAKLEARSVPAYAAAEVEYEECSRLCLIL